MVLSRVPTVTCGAGLRYCRPSNVFAALETRAGPSANPFIAAMDALGVRERTHPSYPEHPYEKGRHRGAAVRVFMFMRVYACVQCVWVHECACVRMFVCMCYLHVCMRVYACVMCVCMRAGPVCSHWRGILLPCNLHLRVLDGAKCRVATAAVVLSGQR